MEIRHLRYFTVVAEELSFTRAARRLHMAQPPLSTQIRLLEQELGVPLFDRSQRAIKLTEAGRALLPEARRLLADLEQTARLVRRAGDGGIGRLGIGFVPSAANGDLPGMLRRHRERFPGVELFLREMDPDALVRGLHERRLDAAFFYLPFEDPALSAVPVAAEELVLALPEGHRLARNPAVDLRELAGEPFILPARHQMPGLYAYISELLATAGVSPQVVQKDVWMLQTILGLVSAGLGLALVPASAGVTYRPGVVHRPLREPPGPVRLAVVWRRDDTSAVLTGFLDTVRAHPDGAPPTTT
ncbi:LysR family transcriptional regulator [Actinomadura craniellae]|uniref:LysR family transcriptional regulator n=1 Tax=Actinomadura craniellae TaxID=2231787 RepID=A0A365HB99_9ACTN|nr:LysR family transcriptional regulator [Actinomadura craniellae]RAY16420.1 LysR family transcriptional regulator [Actinomadura craniellae]